MADEPKLRKNKDKTSKHDESADEDLHSESPSEESESPEPDSPVIIEAEAVDVTDVEAEVSGDGDPDLTARMAESEAELPPATTPKSQRSSVLPLLIGGLVAGGIGYGAGTYLNPTPPPFDSTAIVARIAESETRVNTMSETIAALESAPVEVVDLSEFEVAISNLATSLEDVDTDISILREDLDSIKSNYKDESSALSERLAVLETTGSDGPAAVATEEELAAFRAELDRMASEAEARMAAAQVKADAIEKEAADKAAAAEQAALEAEKQIANAALDAERKAAMVKLKAALESGAAFDEILPLIDADIPETLAANAVNGVATLVSLQQSFPEVARSALSKSTAAPQDATTGQKLTAFLKSRTNARSLTPKEGNGADAVLSRAEARLNNGELKEAVAELETLTEAPKEAMQDWLLKANARVSAITAADQLFVTN